MKTEYFTCQCMSDEHTLRFMIDEEDEDPKTIYVTFHLNHFRVFRRIWVAIKYIFGYHCKYGHFEEILLKPEDVPQIVKFVNQLESGTHGGNSP